MSMFEDRVMRVIEKALEKFGYYLDGHYPDVRRGVRNSYVFVFEDEKVEVTVRGVEE